MRTFVDHTVMFLLDKGEGDVVQTATGYGEINSVTVHFPPSLEPRVTAMVRRCRKDGSDDKRMGNVTTSAEIDPTPWIERAHRVIDAEPWRLRA